jgi:hypothetical protein
MRALLSHTNSFMRYGCRKQRLYPHSYYLYLPDKKPNCSLEMEVENKDFTLDYYLCHNLIDTITQRNRPKFLKGRGSSDLGIRAIKVELKVASIFPVLLDSYTILIKSSSMSSRKL